MADIFVDTADGAELIDAAQPYNALASSNDIRNSGRAVVVHVDPILDSEAWTLLTRRLDKDWSLVDCSSFIIMQQMGITEAQTTDHHFEQAGFVQLLK